MNIRFWWSVVALFVVSMGFGFVIHGWLLYGDYSALPNLFRAQADAAPYFPFNIAAHISLAIGFTWIYRHGREAGKPWLGQGVRFGVAVAVLMTIPMYMIYYAVQPMPGALAVKQIVFDTIGSVVMGIVVAAINRDTAA